jgi:DNA-binding transcriptional LysR family regulator
MLVPVASPDFIARRSPVPSELTADDIARLDLIDYERFNAHWISFRQWFARLPSPPKTRITPRLSFSTYSLAVDAALRGEGVTLGSRGLIAEELAAGRLVELGTQSLETGYGYYLGMPRYRSLTPGAARLHQHLLAGL